MKMVSIILISTLVLWLASTLMLIPFANHVAKRRKSQKKSGE